MQPPLLEWNHVSKRYGRTAALRDLHGEVEAHSLMGFVGLNGAGKTTTLQVSLGLDRRYRGTIRLLGFPPGQRHSLRGRVAAVFDTPGLQERWRVRDHLRHAELFQNRSRADCTREWVDRLSLGPVLRKRARELSLGNRRRLAIAMALIPQPEFLILDEPFSGLDTSGVEELLRLLRELHANGTTILLSSHQLHLVQRICTHLAVLHEGTLVARGKTEQLLAADREIVAVGTEDTAAIATQLQEWQLPFQEVVDSAGSVEMWVEAANPAELNRRLVESGIEVRSLRTPEVSLDEFFRRHVGLQEETGRSHDGNREGSA